METFYYEPEICSLIKVKKTKQIGIIIKTEKINDRDWNDTAYHVFFNNGIEIFFGYYFKQYVKVICQGDAYEPPKNKKQLTTKKKMIL